MWRGSSTIKNRLFVCLVYGLPMSSSLTFSVFLFARLTELGLGAIPLVVGLMLAPFIFTYGLIALVIPPDFVGIAVFFGLYFLVVRNERLRHFVRFNTMQALLLYLFSIICSYLFQLLGIGIDALDLGADFFLGIILTTIFLAVFGASLYSIVQALRGLYPEIPVISDAAYPHVR